MTQRSIATGVAVLTVLAAFAVLTAAIVGGRMDGIDRSLLLALRSLAPAHLPLGPRWLQESARDVTALGGFTTLTLITVIAAALLTIHRRGRSAVVLVAAAIGAQVTAEVIKHYVNRPRPLLVPHLDLVYSSSFPSGHAVMSPTVYPVRDRAGGVRRGDPVDRRDRRLASLYGRALAQRRSGRMDARLGVRPGCFLRRPPMGARPAAGLARRVRGVAGTTHVVVRHPRPEGDPGPPCSVRH